MLRSASNTTKPKSISANFQAKKKGRKEWERKMKYDVLWHPPLAILGAKHKSHITIKSG